VLHCDAFLSQTLVRAFFPRVEVHSLDVEMPRLTTVAVHQQIDRLFGKATNSDLFIRECRNLIEAEAAAVRGRVGVITKADTEKKLLALPRPLPANVSLAHYGNQTGMNDLTDVDTLLLIGRNEPSPL